MNSIESVVHFEGRAASHTTTHDVVAHVQEASDMQPLPSSPAPRIQQATISTSQRFTIPTNTMSTSSSSTAPATISNPAAPAQENHGLSSKSIAGLAMIPIAFILITASIFICLWLRKRRRRPIIRHLGLSPPPVPEKDFGSPTCSIDSTNSAKVRVMTAFSTPVVHTGWHASPRPQNASIHHNPRSNEAPRISADITTAAFTAHRAVEDCSDSPIDRSSPFRLKRGNTKKRSSLDSEIMRAWPAPPQPTQPVSVGRIHMKRRSISSEYFAQERESRDVREAQKYWEEIRLELGPDPGPTLNSQRR